MIKRERKICTAETRMAIVKYMDENDSSIRKTAKFFNVDKSTVVNAIKSASILQNMQECNMNMNVSRIFKEDEVNVFVYRWICAARSKGMPVNGPLIRNIALKFSSQVGDHSFGASEGWLESFRKRYAIQWTDTDVKSIGCQTDSINQMSNEIMEAVLAEHRERIIAQKAAAERRAVEKEEARQKVLEEQRRISDEIMQEVMVKFDEEMKANKEAEEREAAEKAAQKARIEQIRMEKREKLKAEKEAAEKARQEAFEEQSRILRERKEALVAKNLERAKAKKEATERAAEERSAREAEKNILASSNSSNTAEDPTVSTNKEPKVAYSEAKTSLVTLRKYYQQHNMTQQGLQILELLNELERSPPTPSAQKKILDFFKTVDKKVRFQEMIFLLSLLAFAKAHKETENVSFLNCKSLNKAILCPGLRKNLSCSRWIIQVTMNDRCV